MTDIREELAHILGRIVARATPNIADDDEDRKRHLYHIDELARKGLARLRAAKEAEGAALKAAYRDIDFLIACIEADGAGEVPDDEDRALYIQVRDDAAKRRAALAKARP